MTKKIVTTGLWIWMWYLVWQTPTSLQHLSIVWMLPVAVIFTLEGILSDED